MGKDIRSIARKRLLGIIAFQLFIFVPVIVGSLTTFYGCGDSSTEIIIHDTDTVIYRDTVIKHDTLDGPRFLRFISFLQKGGLVHLTIQTEGGPGPFATALSQMPREYTPVTSRNPFQVFAEYALPSGDKAYDSFIIPADVLKHHSLTSIALFQVQNEIGEQVLVPYFMDDSLKRFPPPKDSVYFRIINGLPDFPLPAAVIDVSIDDPNGEAIYSSPINFREARNYVLIPSGQHTIYIRKASDKTVLYSQPQLFSNGYSNGGYYTGRLHGRQVDGTAGFTIDAE